MTPVDAEIVRRAREVLMKAKACDEPCAYRLLKSKARATRSTLATAARRILSAERR